jgi:ATP-dependent DNA ligase
VSRIKCLPSDEADTTEHEFNLGEFEVVLKSGARHLDEGDGSLVFAHACKMGLEGIVSKRKDSGYRSGRSPDWIKSKNPAAPAVRREAEEDWGR